MPSNDGGLGVALVGEKIQINARNVHVSKLLGEGGFSYVYLCKEISDGQSTHNTAHGDSVSGSKSGDNKRRGGSSAGTGKGNLEEKPLLVLKVTSIHSRQQRDIAEKEAKLLSRLSHPSIIKMYDTCYRTVSTGGGGFLNSKDQTASKPQHLILMEYCEGGHALDVCNALASDGKRFDLSTLIIAFGQICNAVSYLHAQRPPIVHRDLKPVNFLVKSGAYKLCDFGSAVFGHVDLRTPKARAEAEEVVEKTTTQMFRAPEMVDLYSTKRLTQATDVWALGCCLFSLAFLQNCFEEGSNLAILSRKYKIPEDNPYGDGLVELLDRMLTVDAKARSDMTEVILCLSAVYSGRPLPPRKKVKSKSKSGSGGTGGGERSGGGGGGNSSGGGGGGGGVGGGDGASGVGDGSAVINKSKKKKEKAERAGTYRTDGQGIYNQDPVNDTDGKKKAEPKKLNPNSAAARRRMQAQGDKDIDFSSLHSKFSQSVADNENNKSKSTDPFAFSNTDNFFATVPENSESENKDNNNKVGDAFGTDVFGSFDNTSPNVSAEKAKDAFAAFDSNDAWGDMNASNFGSSYSGGETSNYKSKAQETDGPVGDGDDGGGGNSKSASGSGGRSRDRGVRRTVSEAGPPPGRPSREKSGRRSRRPNDNNGTSKDHHQNEDFSVITEHTEQTAQSSSRLKRHDSEDTEKRRRRHGEKEKHNDRHRPRRTKSQAKSKDKGALPSS